MEEKKYKLSSQAVGAIMLALQKGILEECDITKVLLNYEMVENNSKELVVLNPATFSVSDELMEKIESLKETGDA